MMDLGAVLFYLVVIMLASILIGMLAAAYGEWKSCEIVIEPRIVTNIGEPTKADDCCTIEYCNNLTPRKLLVTSLLEPTTPTDDHTTHVEAYIKSHRRFNPETVWVTNDGELLVYNSFENKFYNDSEWIPYPLLYTIQYLGEL